MYGTIFGLSSLIFCGHRKQCATARNDIILLFLIDRDTERGRARDFFFRFWHKSFQWICVHPFMSQIKIRRCSTKVNTIGKNKAFHPCILLHSFWWKMSGNIFLSALSGLFRGIVRSIVKYSDHVWCF